MKLIADMKGKFSKSVIISFPTVRNLKTGFKSKTSVNTESNNISNKPKPNKKLRTFDEVREFLSSIPNINKGGCGIAVLAMYRWLLKNDLLHLNTRTYFYYCYHNSNKERYDNNYKALYDLKAIPDACAHAVLYYDGRFIDCNGIHNIVEYDLIQKIWDADFILRSVNNLSEWNSDFDRNTMVKRIQKRLNIKMSDIKLRK